MEARVANRAGKARMKLSLARASSSSVTSAVAIVVVGDRASQEAPLRKLGPLELRDLDGGPAGPVTANAHDVGPREARPEPKAPASKP